MLNCYFSRIVRRLVLKMVSCVAYGCTNRNGKQGITFHRFPKDSTTRSLWVKALRRKDWEPSKYSCICSAHFREVDIDRTSLSCVRIRDGAVPSIFPSFPLFKQKKLGRLRKKLRKCDDNDEGGNMDAVVQQIIMNPPEVIIKEEPVVKEEAECDVGAGAQQKLGRLRKKLRKCDDNDEGGNMDAVVQQIIMNPPEVIIKEEPVVKEEAECDVGAGAQQNPPEVIIKEEPVVKEEAECDSGDVGTGAQQDFEYVSVKEEPIEDLDESTSSASEDFEYASVKEDPIEDLDESTSSAPESYEQMGQDQELPLIIKEEIDCDDYIDPFHIS